MWTLVKNESVTELMVCFKKQYPLYCWRDIRWRKSDGSKDIGCSGVDEDTFVTLPSSYNKNPVSCSEKELEAKR